jgi:1,5-anhydro-D-fructose reductase (1,5-anhydro-D-mannitol-forming)
MNLLALRIIFARRDSITNYKKNEPANLIQKRCMQIHLFFWPYVCYFWKVKSKQTFMSVQKITWGIIGCGDVCEVKSGPAFQKSAHSTLLAVMRRDALKAADFANRHKVPEHYSDARKIIQHPEINAVYIATPPAYHESYAMACMQAGKNVYIEKPLTLDAASTSRLIEAKDRYGAKACGAYYRRALPLFLKIKELLGQGALGKIRLVQSRLIQSYEQKWVAQSETIWRLQPEISGGGLFHDLAPHQLDIVYWLFGAPKHKFGSSYAQTGNQDVPDIASFEGVFKDELHVQGIWMFNAAKENNLERCEIYGEKGSMAFSFFREPVLELQVNGKLKKLKFDIPKNIQWPMIEKVNQYFRGEGANPCSLEEALESMKMLDSVS